MTINKQFYIYGTIVSYEWLEKWNIEKVGTVSEVIDELYDLKEITDDDISCIFYGRDGKSLIIGKIIKEFENEEAIIINELDDKTKKEIELSVKNNYNLTTEFNHYYIKTYYINSMI